MEPIDFGFDHASFIQNSNLIDKQFNERGILIPGSKPGEKMYDNMLEALVLAKQLAEQGDPYPGIDRDLHRALTRGLSVFENEGMSGNYRVYNVRIGAEHMPQHPLVPHLMSAVWLPYAKEMREWALKDPESAWSYAMDMHHMFECIHPFIDGNGRTGRLLLCWFMWSVGQQPRVIEFEKRYEYYHSIQRFRQLEFDEIVQRFVRGGEDSHDN